MAVWATWTCAGRWDEASFPQKSGSQDSGRLDGAASVPGFLPIEGTHSPLCPMFLLPDCCSRRVAPMDSFIPWLLAGFSQWGLLEV